MASRGRCDVRLADADYIRAYIISPLGTVYSIESFLLKSARVVDTSSRDFDADDASVNFIRNLLIRWKIIYTNEAMINPNQVFFFFFFLIYRMYYITTIEIGLDYI